VKLIRLDSGFAQGRLWDRGGGVKTICSDDGSNVFGFILARAKKGIFKGRS
jgi:hypothetical protein